MVDPSNFSIKQSLVFEISLTTKIKAARVTLPVSFEIIS